MRKWEKGLADVIQDLGLLLRELRGGPRYHLAKHLDVLQGHTDGNRSDVLGRLLVEQVRLLGEDLLHEEVADVGELLVVVLNAFPINRREVRSLFSY